jgi:small subunit ribosomal protein S14
MAKTSMVNRDIKRAKLAKKHAAKRAALKKIIASQDASYDEKMDARPSCRSCRAIRIAQPQTQRAAP